MITVTAVSVTYNSANDLAEFFRCLRDCRQESLRSGIDLRAVVVDNCSSDSTPEVLTRVSQSEAGWVQIHLATVNHGIAVGNNLGIEMASGSDFILLLNTDVSFPPTLVAELVQVSSASRALVSPQISMASGTKLWYDGGSISAHRSFRASHHRIGQPMSSASPEPLSIEGYASTCALLVPTQVFADVGLMDEDFFVYNDDVDFAIRCKDAGWRTVIHRGITLDHRVGGSTGGTRGPFGARWETFGLVLLARKHSARRIARIWNVVFICFWALRQSMRAGSRSDLYIRARAIRDGLASDLRLPRYAAPIASSSSMVADNISTLRQL